MKFGSRKGWKSLVPFRVNKRPTTRSCLFPKVKRASQTPGYAPVYLNVYDLTPVNGYICWAGIGVFHSGVEVYGVEYAFGAHDFPSSGVFEVEPRQCPGFKFRKSILIGTTRLDPFQLRQFMELQSLNYNGDSYHLITKNCNHFCKDICFKLTSNYIPKWVNRLARIGALCNCILPGALKISAIRQDPDCVPEDSERRRLMGSFNCFSSISLSQKQPSQSSSSLLGSSRAQKSCPPASLKLT